MFNIYGSYPGIFYTVYSEYNALYSEYYALYSE